MSRLKLPALLWLPHYSTSTSHESLDSFIFVSLSSRPCLKPAVIGFVPYLSAASVSIYVYGSCDCKCIEGQTVERAAIQILPE
ncbi:hypothetical protein J3R30DRAFT_622939 [Lentinula aciculospora]|uniref:Uncharacterized protein n=1 Tax=Lentinula aciculospora TaxID=153920 RepID=A0A9W9DKK7_9AGAR|nr:hypothetical protein J3R30DRAFT_622939 [Lentinula aciculospora]